MKDVLILITAIVIALVFALGISYGVERFKCSNYGNVTGNQTKLSLFVCYVKDDEKWYELEEFKLRNATEAVKNG
jgi:hypothetical protein